MNSSRNCARACRNNVNYLDLITVHQVGSQVVLDASQIRFSFLSHPSILSPSIARDYSLSRFTRRVPLFPWTGQCDSSVHHDRTKLSELLLKYSSTKFITVPLDSPKKRSRIFFKRHRSKISFLDLLRKKANRSKRKFDDWKRNTPRCRWWIS